MSVIVPTCRRPELLRRCLQALVAQDFDPACYEVIVVNDDPDDATRQVVEEEIQAARRYALNLEVGASSAAHAVVTTGGTKTLTLEAAGGLSIEEQTGVRLRYLPAPGALGPAAARNLGWRLAEAPLIAFTDDDCLPTPGWLRHGLRGFVDGVAGVQGRVIVPLDCAPTDYELNVAGLETSDFVTANCFYRRAVLAALGGFDERFRMAWLEDRDLWFRLLQRGARLERAEEAVVIHPVRPARFGISLGQQRKSLFNALLYKKHPEMYRRMQPPPPYHYYASLGCALLALIGLAAGTPLVAALAGSGWAALTLAFLRRRLERTSRRPKHVFEMAVTSILIPPLSVFWRLRGALQYRVFFW